MIEIDILFAIFGDRNKKDIKSAAKPTWEDSRRL
jgi:hypothetical protein